MPAWKGWDEFEIRDCLPANIPVMAGFTPINVPASTASTNTMSAADRDAGNRMPITGSRWSNSIASEYLGRGEPEQPAQLASQAGAKKGKKRASTANASSKAKRRKSSDVSDGLTVKKLGAHEDGSSPLASTKKPISAKQADSSNILSSTRKRKRVQHDEGTDSTAQPRSELIRPVQVYAHATSMDSVLSGSHTTSVAALKASLNHGATLFSSAQEASIQQGDANFTRSLLNSSAAGDATRPRTTRARNAANGSVNSSSSGVLGGLGSAQRRELSPVEEEDDLNLMLESLAKQFDAPIARTKPEKEARMEAHLPTPMPSDAPMQTTSVRKQPSLKAKTVSVPQVQTEEDFIVLDNSDDEALADAAESMERATPLRSPTPPPRDRKQNMRDVQSDDDYGGALLTATERHILNELQASAQCTEKRIVRSAYPASVLDRSPIFGATNATVLRVCFRIGEALNAGCLAVRNNKSVLLELYARVTESRREEKPGRHQHLVFHDLYHDKPPYLTGTFDLWDQSRLWELDSRVFLTPKKEGVICRAVARMRRDGMKWKLEVLSIWAASWEDVEHVAGI